MANNYLDNVKVNPKFDGISGLLCPFPGHNAAARLDMFASHINQFLIPAKGEHPQVFTGFESLVADYEFNTAEINQDIKIVDVIPKYSRLMTSNIMFNPFITVVYIGLDDGKLSYFNLYKYTQCSNGYGYENKWENENLLSKDTIVPKGTKFYHSSAHEGDEYRIGVNANIAYMTMFETSEDAFVISEDLAKRLQPIGLKTISIKIDSDQYPLNLYGTEEEYKIIPDIGETVRDDNVIIAFRKATDNNIITDLNDNKVFDPEYMYDTCIFAPSDSTNAVVIDIDVYLSKKGKIPKNVFQQIKKYHNGSIEYFRRIVSVYNKYKHHQLDFKFNTLVTDAMSRLAAVADSTEKNKHRSKKMLLNLIDKDKIINLQIDIKLLYPKIINNGFKFTGRDGAKGTACKILKTEDMPIDENGVRVDMVIDPMSVAKRTNVGQLYEQNINKALEAIRDRIKKQPNEIIRGFDLICNILNDINPNFAKLVRETYNTKEKQKDYINHIIKNGISVHVPPFLDSINSSLPIKLKEKYGLKSSRLSFNIYDRNGNKKRITTKEKIDIGKKYIYVLCKIPRSASCGGAYINQYKIPVHPSKMGDLKFPVHQTPIRFGEDEFRILSITVGPRTALRHRTLYGTSMKGVTKLIETILTADKPSNIRKVDISTDELHDDDFIINIANNMFRTCAIEPQKVLISPNDLDKVMGGMTTEDISNAYTVHKKKSKKEKKR